MFFLQEYKENLYNGTIKEASANESDAHLNKLSRCFPANLIQDDGSSHVNKTKKQADDSLKPYVYLIFRMHMDPAVKKEKTDHPKA